MLREGNDKPYDPLIGLRIGPGSINLGGLGSRRVLITGRVLRVYIFYSWLSPNLFFISDSSNAIR